MIEIVSYRHRHTPSQQHLQLWPLGSSSMVDDTRMEWLCSMWDSYFFISDCCSKYSFLPQAVVVPRLPAHPAPLPQVPQPQPSNPRWLLSPPKPTLKISKLKSGKCQSPSQLLFLDPIMYINSPLQVLFYPGTWRGSRQCIRGSPHTRYTLTRNSSTTVVRLSQMFGARLEMWRHCRCLWPAHSRSFIPDTSTTLQCELKMNTAG